MMHAGRCILNSQALKVGHRAMGLTAWVPFLIGALVGQLGGVLQLVVWWTWGVQQDTQVVETAVSRAVAETLKFCVDSDIRTTSPTPPSAIVEFPRVWLIWVVVIIQGLLIVVIIVLWWWCNCRSRPTLVTSEDQLALGDSSPSDSGQSLRVLARNQLAEIRLRHANQQTRLARV